MISLMLAVLATGWLQAITVTPRVPGANPIVAAQDPATLVQPEIPGHATAHVWAMNGSNVSDPVVWSVDYAPVGVEVTFGQGTSWTMAPGELRRQDVLISTDTSAPRIPAVPFQVVVEAE